MITMIYLFSNRFSIWDTMGILYAVNKLSEDLYGNWWVGPAIFAWLLAGQIVQKEMKSP